MTSSDSNETSEILYLVQHGESKTEAEDPERSLTDNGHATVEHVAAWAAAAGVRVDEIRHSGKRRAEQTAEVFAKHLKPDFGVKAVPGLKPMDDVRAVAETLSSESGALMLVGHLPFMSRLAGLLLTGDPDRPVVQFRNGGLVGLARQAQGWSVVCVVPPDMVR